MGELLLRARQHAALGDPTRLGIVDSLRCTDRSPHELSDMLGIPSNLLAFHLDVLEGAGLVRRRRSEGDGRQRYVTLQRSPAKELGMMSVDAPNSVLFICTHNSARSQLAAAWWHAQTGQRAFSAGTTPADRVHPVAVDVATAFGLSLAGERPTLFGEVPRGVDRVITVCDRARETVATDADWWHWSIPDPAPSGAPAAFEAAFDEIRQRVDYVGATT